MGSSIIPRPLAYRGRIAELRGSSDRFVVKSRPPILIVLNEAPLRSSGPTLRITKKSGRTHLSLDKDAPDFQRAQPVGNIAALAGAAPGDRNRSLTSLQQRWRGPGGRFHTCPDTTGFCWRKII